MGSGHIHVQLHEDAAFNFTLTILRQKNTPRESELQIWGGQSPPALWVCGSSISRHGGLLTEQGLGEVSGA